MSGLPRRFVVLSAVLSAALFHGCSADNGTTDTGVRRDAARDTGGTTDNDVGTTPDSNVQRFDVQALDVVTTPDDVMELDGSGIYDDVTPAGDACAFGSMACTPHASGCVSTEIQNNGLDDNCNGMIDEGSSCLPGDVQRCFRGPPGRRGLGVCADGMQTCQGSGEFGSWGPCVGGIAPSGEVCDDADNDCDGCPDNGLCCRAPGSCPSADDPRVPVGRPFAPYALMGATFYPGPARAWQWRVEGGPCDQLLYATSSHVSYTLGGAGSDPRVTTQQNLAFNPTLSGDYTVTLTVTQTDGTTFVCTFVVRIRAPGFRVELCWDRTGMTDIDLWVHRPHNTANWTSGSGILGGLANVTCGWSNCRNADALSWGYATTAGGACREPVGGNCNNPRLDIDNIATVGVPENINVDNPAVGDDFRVAVNYYGGTGAVQPMVNIYCGGALQGTYGGARVAGTLYGSDPVTGFNTSGQDTSGSLWRVVDVVMDTATTCTRHQLVTSGTTNPCVVTANNRSYNGTNCVRR